MNKNSPEQMLFSQPFWATSDFAASNRKRNLKIILSLILLLFGLRLAQLQIIEYGQYSTRSETQAIKKVSVTPVRGNMYDRNDELIVNNIPSFSVTITPYEFRKESMPLLSNILKIDSNEIYKILNKYKSYSKFVPIKIMCDADPVIVSQLEEYSDYLFGVDVAIDSKRVYDFDCNMAHMLGYTGEITREQLEKYGYYKPGDMIGKSGLEQSYENILHGRDGVEFVAVNKVGQRVAAFADGEKDILASNGFDLNLSIDLKLQELSEKLLAGRRGAIVAIDPNNGEVLGLASKPDYDPRSFSGKVPYELYKSLSEDETSPLLARSIQAQYPPGSTWKMLIALAGLQEGLINENTTITCTGSYTLGGRTYGCHHNGSVNVRQAIRSSCNVFFYILGMKLGMERFEKYGQMFNFGEQTQIDIPNEKKGRLPTREWLQRRDKTLTSFVGRLINYGIGQGEILVTPLQMAAYTAAIANGGTYYQPHIVRSVFNQLTKTSDNLNYDVKKIPIESRYFNIVKDGMWDVVNAGGTGSGVCISGLDVCGKTGTAQNPHGADHSWFICFAPKKNPKIAICVFVENAGFGAAVAAPMARQVLETFFYPDRVKSTMSPEKHLVDTTHILQNEPEKEMEYIPN